jgi:hypothetical protein
MPLDTIHSAQKRVQYGLNVMNPKVRLEVKVFVDRHSKLTNSKWATNKVSVNRLLLLLQSASPTIQQCNIHSSTLHLYWASYASHTPNPGTPAGSLVSCEPAARDRLLMLCVLLSLCMHVCPDACAAYTVQASAAFKYLALRCRGEAPDTFQEQLSTALAAHRTLMEQQQRKQQQQQAQGSQQQPYSSQQQAVPWASNAGPVSHPIAGPLATGSFDGPLAPGLMWGDSSSSQHHQQQQQQYQGGGLPPRSPAGHRMGLQAVDGELLTQLMDMVSVCARGWVGWSMRVVGHELAAACWEQGVIF